MPQRTPSGGFGRHCAIVVWQAFDFADSIRSAITLSISPVHRLIVEADGGQHADNHEDDVPTALLQADGRRVIRFWNNDVCTNKEGVIETILPALCET